MVLLADGHATAGEDEVVAEGSARRGRGEFVHFVSIARGSLAELETYLELLPRLGYASPDDTIGLLDQASAVGRQLTNLRNHLAAQTRT